MSSTINAATSGGLISTGDTSGQLQLQTAGTTALTVTSAQLVGIGTSSPSNKVTVSTSGSYDGIAVNSSSTTTATRVVMNNNTSQYLQLDVGSSGRSSYGPSGPNVVSITSGASGGFNLGTDDATPLAFYTNLNERMRITSAGLVGIGTTTPTTSIYINGAPSTASITIQRSDEGGYGGRVGCGNTIYGPASARSLGLDGYSSVNFGIAGTQRMVLDSSGALTLTIGQYITGNVTPLTAASVASNPGTAAVWDGSGNLYKLASSLRYKENITDWTVTDEQLNAFINVNPKLWDYIGKENGCAGFIAEDIEALGLKNAYNTSPLINYSNEGLPDSNRDFALIALQHKVLQKQQALIESLKARLDAANL